MFSKIVTIIIAILILQMWCMGQESALKPSVLVVWQEGSPEYKQALDKFVAGLTPDVAAKCQILTSEAVSQQPGKSYFADIEMCVVIGTKAAVLVEGKVPRGVPIAYCMVYSPSKVGLLDDRENFGVSLAVSIEDQFKLIDKVLPSVKVRATMVTQEQYNGNLWPVGELKEKIAGIKYTVIPDKIVNDARAGYVNELIGLRADVIWTYPDANVFHLLTMKLLLLESIKKKIPVFGYSENMVKAGALFGVSVEMEKQGSRLAEQVNKVLAGEELEQRHMTAEFKPVFNIAVADTMKVKIPEELLAQAKYVYGK